MRTVYLVLFMLGTIGWLAANIDVNASPSHLPGEGPWRRTVDGWESSTRWLPDPTPARPSLHPAVVASFQVLLSAWALLITQPRRERDVETTAHTAE